MLADEQGKHQSEEADKKGDRGVAKTNGEFEERSIAFPDETFHAVGDFSLLTEQPAEIFTIRSTADFTQGKVVGEHQFGFDQ